MKTSLWKGVCVRNASVLQATCGSFSSKLGGSRDSYVDFANCLGALKEDVSFIAQNLWNDIRAIIQHVILLQIICNNTTSGIMKTGIIRIQA